MTLDRLQSVDAARGSSGALKLAAIAVLALGCAIPFAMNVVDPDLWGHVRYGQDWLAAGEMPRTATHTFTAEGYPWVNHENSFELAAAWGYEQIGVYGLLVVKCALGLAIVATMVWVASWRGVPALSAWVLMVVVAANLQAFFPIRPQLFSFALFAVMAVCLDRAFAYWHESRRVRWAWLAPLPLVFAAWVNSHGGFVAGLCILGTYLAGRMVELVVDGRRTGRLSDQSRTFAGLAIVGIACLAATLINPYGLELHQWMAYAMWTPQPEITEWRPPSWDNPVFMPFVTLASIAVVCLVATHKRRDWTQVVILVLIGVQAAMHLRHIAFFALACGFWLPEHWQSAVLRMKPDEPWRWPTKIHSLGARLAGLAALVGVVAVESTLLAGRLSDFPVYRSSWPVDAVQYMVDHRLGGKLVVSFNWAQYALSALAPEVTVSFDGRFDTCYPDDVIDMNFDFLLGNEKGERFRNPASGPFDAMKVLNHLDPDMVLIERRYRDAPKIMRGLASRGHKTWTLLYSDAVAELWGRVERYNDPKSPHYLPPAQREFDLKLLEARFQWPALPDRSLLEEQERRVRSPGVVEESIPPTEPVSATHVSEL